MSEINGGDGIRNEDGPAGMQEGDTTPIRQGAALGDTTPIPAPSQPVNAWQAPTAQYPAAAEPPAQAQQPEPQRAETQPEASQAETRPMPPYAGPQHSVPQYPSAQSPATPSYGQPYGQPYSQPAEGQAYGSTGDQPNGSTHADAGYPASNTYPHALAPAVTAAPQAAKPRRKVGMGMFAASVIAAALIGGGAAAGTSALIGSQNSGTVAASNQQAAPLVINNPTSVNQISAAAAKAMPSVVTISATSGSSGGTGSGIILDTAGHILTNTHVVTLDGAAAHATIQVQTSDGKVYAGTVVGTDPLSDLAVIKIDAPNLVPATLGDSTKINVGDTVIAIGSPLGLNATVTEGIISTLNRTIQVASSAVPATPNDSSQGQGGGNGFQFSPPGGGQSNTAATGSVNLNVIQTDAAINPGNSGGALVDSTGKIIGVNVAIASTGSSSSSTSQSGNIGVGFSIPIDHAKRIANDIISSGKATHGQLGVSVSGTSALGSNSQFSAGATVADVTSGSAAAKAGIQKGDVITALGGRTISDASSLTAAVREEAGGATVKVTLVRNGKTLEKDVTLDTMPAN